MFIGFVLVIAGVIFLLEKLGIVTGSIWSYVWPCLLVALGLSIILGKKHIRIGSIGRDTRDDKENRQQTKP